MKRILLLLGLGALFTAFFINIGGVDLLPDWLGSLFFALGVTGVGRRGGESLATPAMIAWYRCCCAPKACLRWASACSLSFWRYGSICW